MPDLTLGQKKKAEIHRRHFSEELNDFDQYYVKNPYKITDVDIDYIRSFLIFTG